MCVLTSCVFQVWGAEAGVAHGPPSDLLWKSQGSWGTGDDIITILVNSDGEVCREKNTGRLVEPLKRPTLYKTALKAYKGVIHDIIHFI